MNNTIILPIFPLGIVAFPGEFVNLHIFEPRYRQLIRECDATDKHFGIPAIIDKKLMIIGTEMRLLNIEKVYPTGEMDIKLMSVGLFHITDYFPVYQDKLYGAVEATQLGLDLVGNPVTNEKIYKYVNELFVVLNIQKPLPPLNADFNTYKIGHQVGFSLEQEYDFLQILVETERQDFMLEHLERMIPMVRQMHNLQDRVKLNGHFKHISSGEWE